MTEHSIAERNMPQPNQFPEVPPPLKVKMKSEIDSGKIPRLLYKYMSIDRLRDFLFSGQLYFADYRQFNDPFEGKWAIKVSVVNERGEHMLKATELNLLNQGVFCCTIRNNNLLMWAHYADSHRGCCVGFDASKDIDFFYYPHRVEYNDTYPTYPPDTNKSFKINHISDVLLRKSSDWSYEQEYRVVKNGFVGAREIDPQAVRSITLGCECKRVEEIRSFLERVECYNHIKVRKATRNKTAYRLIIT